MVSERRISHGEISRYLDEMQREIDDLERRLQSLREASGGNAGGGSSAGRGMTSSTPAPARRGPGRPPGGGVPRGRRPGRPAGGGQSAGAGAGAAAAASAPAAAPAGRKGRGRGKTPITAEQLASRQLQGRYLGLIRQIPASRRAQYQRTAKEQGREAAIRQMQETLRK